MLSKKKHKFQFIPFGNLSESKVALKKTWQYYLLQKTTTVQKKKKKKKRKKKKKKKKIKKKSM